MDCHWFRMPICRTRSFIEKVAKSKLTEIWGCFITVPFILYHETKDQSKYYIYSYMLIKEILRKYTLILIYKCSQIWTNLAGNFLDLQVCETRFRMRIKKSPNPNKRIYISLLRSLFQQLKKNELINIRNRSRHLLKIRQHFKSFSMVLKPSIMKWL